MLDQDKDNNDDQDDCGHASGLRWRRVIIGCASSAWLPCILVVLALLLLVLLLLLPPPPRMLCPGLLITLMRLVAVAVVHGRCPCPSEDFASARALLTSSVPRLSSSSSRYRDSELFWRIFPSKTFVWSCAT